MKLYQSVILNEEGFVELWPKLSGFIVDLSRIEEGLVGVKFGPYANYLKPNEDFKVGPLFLVEDK